MKLWKKFVLENINCKLKIISFPKEEHKTIKSQLKKYGKIITTRVDNEIGKFKLNKIYLSPWNDLLKVIDIKTFKNIIEHPYYKFLTNEQIKLISKYDKYEVLTLKQYINNETINR